MATTLENLKQEISAKQVLAIVGAGISIGATGNSEAASWKGLLRNGVARCLDRRKLGAEWAARLHAQIEGDMIDLLCAAENISERLGAPDGRDYADWLEETVGALEATDTCVVNALVELNVPIATTNYDDVIERATGLREVTWKNDRGVQSLVRGRSIGVLHLHGHWRHPDSVVFGIRSYENLLRNEGAQNMLRSLFTVKTLLFVGFGNGLADPNFGALLRWAGRMFYSSSYPCYHLCLESEREQLEREAQRAVVAVPYGDDFSKLCAFLQGLK